MSVFERAIGTLKDVLLLREQLAQMRVEMARMGDNVGSLIGDIRALEQRLARVEGFIEGAAATAGRQPRLPRT